MNTSMPEIEATLGLRLNDSGRLNLIVRSGELSQEIQLSPKKGSPAESTLLEALLTHQIMGSRGTRRIAGTEVSFAPRVVDDGIIEAVMTWDRNVLRLTIRPEAAVLIFHQPYTPEAMNLLTGLIPALGVLQMNLTTPQEGSTFVDVESLSIGQHIKLSPTGAEARLLATPWASEHNRVVVRIALDDQHTTVRLLAGEHVHLVAENPNYLTAQIDLLSDEHHRAGEGSVRFTQVQGQRVRLIASYFDDRIRQDYIIEIDPNRHQIFLPGQLPSSVFDKLCELVPSVGLLKIKSGSANSALLSDLLRYAEDRPEVSVKHDKLTVTVLTPEGSVVIDAKASTIDLGSSKLTLDELTAAAPLLKMFTLVSSAEGIRQTHWREATMKEVRAGEFFWREGHGLKRREEVQISEEMDLDVSSEVVAPHTPVVVVSQKLAHLGAAAGLSSTQDWITLCDALLFADKHGLNLT